MEWTACRSWCSCWKCRINQDKLCSVEVVSLSNPFAIDRKIISLFDVESQILVASVTTRASRANFNNSDTIKLPALKNPLFGAWFSKHQMYIPFYKPSYSWICVNLKFLNFRYCGNKCRSEEKLKDTAKLSDTANPLSGARICDITVTRDEI